MLTKVAMPLLEAPSAIPGYRLEELIERRLGLWSTYQAVALDSGQPVEVTIVSAHLQHEASYRARFEHDVQQAARLRHPALVSVLAGGLADRGLFLVSDVPGDRQLLDVADAGERSAERMLGLVTPVAHALDAVHEHGLVHGAVMPTAIALAPRRPPQLLGLGLSDEVTARHDEFLDDRPYLAPELLRGAAAAPAADVYGLAATLYRCLTGEAPSPTRARHAGVPKELTEILGRGMAVDPARRPSSAGDFAAECMRVIFAGSPSSRTADPRPARPRTRARTPPAERAPRAGAAEADSVAEAARPAQRRASRAAHPVSAAQAARLARRRRARRRGALLAVFVAAAVAAAIGSLLAGRNRDPDRPSSASAPPVRSTVVATDGLALTVPPRWSKASTGELPGVPAEKALRLAPAGADAGASGLVAGVAADVDHRLLAPELAAGLESAPVGEPVRLGRYAALRYRDLAIASTDRRLTLYAVPTSGGAATVGCFAHTSAAGGFLGQCESVATSLVLDGLEPQALGPDRAYVGALNANLKQLKRQRTARRKALRDARTPARQARIADALARSYNAAAKTQAAAPAGLVVSRFNEQIVGDMRVIAKSYTAAALAARARSTAGFDRVRGAVSRGERRLTIRLKNLEDLGDYSVG